MILSYAWLEELVDLPMSPSELAEVLTFLGLEVEAMQEYRPALDRVVIGEVKECARIEGTDHLFITKTDVGGEVLPMVCGAPNTRAGLKAVVMLLGSRTADGHEVKKAKLRGQESHGMLASEKELGLSDDHTGIIEGDSEWKVGAPAAKYLDLADTTYDVEVTPNRPDFLSHVGVARDLAAKFRLPWRWPSYPLREISEPASSKIAVEILAPEACPRYAARIVRGIHIAPSPYSLRLRVMRCGMRPISNIVDATNLLMLEFGQPLHAFDLRFIEGSKIVVRYAGAGEEFVTLDGKGYKLRARDLLIADAKKGVALAGIMGGLNSEIRDDTETVLIECAYFDPVHVRRTAHTYGLGTESSRRFERGMDPNGVERVIDATASLMQQLAGGEVLAGRVDAYPRKIQPRNVSFRPERADALVGLRVEQAEQKDILERLGCKVSATGKTWQVEAPTHRPDLEREVDLIEEVIRVHGYEHIPIAEVSRVPLSGRDNPMFALRSKVADAMVSLGFHETLSVSMYTADARRDPPDMPEGVRLKNPVTDDMAVMQGSLLPQLVRGAAANFQRGDREVRLFEVARVFHEGLADDPRTWERQVLGALMTGRTYPPSWAHPSMTLDFYDLKGVIEVLCAKISLDKVEIICYDLESGEVLKGRVTSGEEEIGRFGIWPAEQMASRDLDADVAWLELDLSAAASHVVTETTYSPLPKFPISWRDMAVVVDEGVSVAELLATVNGSGGDFLVRAEPFDVYRGDKLGPGKKSVAIRLEFSHPERSLESEEVDGWMEKILHGLRVAHQATLR